MKLEKTLIQEVTSPDRLSTFELNMIVRETMRPLLPVVMNYWNDLSAPPKITRVVQVAKLNQPDETHVPRLLSELAESAAAIIHDRTGFKVEYSNSYYMNYTICTIKVEETNQRKKS